MGTAKVKVTCRQSGCRVRLSGVERERQSVICPECGKVVRVRPASVNGRTEATIPQHKFEV